MDKLVSTEWLAARLGADDLVVLDATMHLPDSGRDARAEFEAGHIAGARFLELESFVDPHSTVPKAVPTAKQFAARMSELGVSSGSRIVLYDDSAIKSSARAWFILERYGEEDVAVLDGGLGKWREEGRKLSQRIVEHAPRPRSDPGIHRDVRGKDAVLKNVSNAQWQIVDARDAARYAGEEGSGSAGHIPSAKNLHFARLFNENGTYKSPDAIRREFESAGVDLEQSVITTCNSGVTATVLLFALELLGQNDAALYDGSWLEWGSDPATPKESGAYPDNG